MGGIHGRLPPAPRPRMGGRTLALPPRRAGRDGTKVRRPSTESARRPAELDRRRGGLGTSRAPGDTVPQEREPTDWEALASRHAGPVTFTGYEVTDEGVSVVHD